jgi:lambda family phage portal protein
VAYHFFHSLSSSNPKTKRIPASDIIHLYRKDRASQIRGTSWLAPVLLRMKDLDDFEDAELLRQKLAACFVGFYRDLESMGEDPFSNTDGSPKEILPGSIFKAPSGQTLEFSAPPQTAGFSSYTRNSKLSLSAGLGVPYMMLSGDYSEANYSSSRMAMLNFFRFVECIQSQILIPSLCLKIEGWLRESLSLKGKDVRRPLVWSVPRKEMVDPGKDIEALKLAVEAGFRSHASVVREFGDDPQDVYSEIGELKKIFDHIGVSFFGSTDKKTSP